MKIKYHEGIYYPSDKKEIETLTALDTINAPARALIVPHMALSYASPLLKTAFTHFGTPDFVIILSPIHSGRMESDKNHCFFEGDENSDCGLKRLGAADGESYAEEESAAEILIPFIERHSVHFAIIYTDIRTAKESRELEAFLRKNSTDDTLFIISSNFSPACKEAEEADRWLERGIEVLEKGESVLDSMNRHISYLCARGAVDAVDRVCGRGWELLGEERGRTTSHAVMWKSK